MVDNEIDKFLDNWMIEKLNVWTNVCDLKSWTFSIENVQSSSLALCNSGMQGLRHDRFQSYSTVVLWLAQTGLDLRPTRTDHSPRLGRLVNLNNRINRTRVKSAARHDGVKIFRSRLYVKISGT